MNTHPIFFELFPSCIIHTYNTRLQRVSCLYRQLKRAKLRKRGIRYLFHLHSQLLSLVGPKSSPFRLPPPFLTNILFGFHLFFGWSRDLLHIDCPLANHKAQEFLSEATMRYWKIWNPKTRRKIATGCNDAPSSSSLPRNKIKTVVMAQVEGLMDRKRGGGSTIPSRDRKKARNECVIEVASPPINTWIINKSYQNSTLVSIYVILQLLRTLKNSFGALFSPTYVYYIQFYIILKKKFQGGFFLFFNFFKMNPHQ